MPVVNGWKLSDKPLWALGTKQSWGWSWRLVQASQPRDLPGVERVWLEVDPEYLPDREALEEWAMDSVCEATDGCRVEPDGICPHGHPSWLLVLGYI